MMNVIIRNTLLMKPIEMVNMKFLMLSLINRNLTLYRNYRSKEDESIFSLRYLSVSKLISKFSVPIRDQLPVTLFDLALCELVFLEIRLTLAPFRASFEPGVSS